MHTKGGEGRHGGETKGDIDDRDVARRGRGVGVIPAVGDVCLRIAEDPVRAGVGGSVGVRYGGRGGLEGVGGYILE